MNRLKELRQEKKLSQKELTENIGVHYRTLQNWENGESQIKPEKAKQLADYFGVSVGYLLNYTNSIIKNFLFYVSLGLPNPYITRFLTKITNITVYYLLPQSTQKGEQKSPTKGLRFDEFSRQETSTVKRAFFIVGC
jgi:putative transcriptional regulator